MRARLRSRTFIFCVALLVVATGNATAAPQLLLHWDRDSGSSQAVVKNSDDDVLAELPWPGALPRRYSVGEEEGELPTFILASLRDQVEASSQPEADEAFTFVRELLGLHADTPVAQLTPSVGTWVPYASYQVLEWCGSEVDTDGECVASDPPVLQNTLCTGFACKGTKIEPAE